MLNRIECFAQDEKIKSSVNNFHSYIHKDLSPICHFKTPSPCITLSIVSFLMLATFRRQEKTDYSKMHGDSIKHHSFQSTSTMPSSCNDCDIKSSMKVFKDFFANYFYTLQLVEKSLLYSFPQECISHNAHTL